MTERQRQRNHEQRTRSAGGSPGSDSGTDVDFDQMRADANRLLSIVDSSYARVRAVDSEQHLLHNRQRGGQ